MTRKMTKELIDRIFKEPGIKYELSEFETLGKPIVDLIEYKYPDRYQKIKSGLKR
jgi:hypothetical protein